MTSDLRRGTDTNEKEPVKEPETAEERVQKRWADAIVFAAAFTAIAIGAYADSRKKK